VHDLLPGPETPIDAASDDTTSYLMDHHPEGLPERTNDGNESTPDPGRKVFLAITHSQQVLHRARKSIASSRIDRYKVSSSYTATHTPSRVPSRSRSIAHALHQCAAQFLDFLIWTVTVRSAKTGTTKAAISQFLAPHAAWNESIVFLRKATVRRRQFGTV